LEVGGVPVELLSNRRKRTILIDYKRHIPGATAFTIREGSAEFTAAISNYALGKDPGGVDAFIHELDRGLDRVINPSWESGRYLW
jgi:hypothetical protein